MSNEEKLSELDQFCKNVHIKILEIEKEISIIKNHPELLNQKKAQLEPLKGSLSKFAKEHDALKESIAKRFLDPKAEYR